ncbi:uncharacterized protein DSM5745_07078 [Aspergillus mulundensis]|uniref:Uncharacterized protein n=1 Tax=Aspergillus mulundensis TaxID=1810919 RepID=A0A3D8RKE1_9EURO|nr:hypothetical protein DSM5745_07078 [Aspergillus mulundensis]RDW74416.1 hypothetical protein DSM5745_07078 [Aspergillus mulundensis]
MRSQDQNRASGRHHARSAPTLLPIAPRPPSSPPASTAIQPSSRSGYRDGRGSQPPDVAARTAASTSRARAAVAATGGRGTPQGAPHHRIGSHSTPGSRSSTSSSSMRSPEHQQYALQPDLNHHGSLSPLAMPLGSFSPPLCSISDIPGSMSLFSPYEHPYGSLDTSFLDASDGLGAAAFPSLEDFDLDTAGFQDDLMQGEWRWFAEDHEHSLR